MSKGRLQWWLPVIVLVVVGRAFAQAPSQPVATSDGWRELANELRLLRLAVDAGGRNQVRFEMLIQRTRLQQETVAGLSQRLDDTRSELSTLRAAAIRTNGQVQILETQLRQSSTQDQRVELDTTLQDLKATSQQQAARETELQERLNRLTYDTRAEQARLDELNTSLNTVFSEASQPAALSQR